MMRVMAIEREESSNKMTILKNKKEAMIVASNVVEVIEEVSEAAITLIEVEEEVTKVAEKEKMLAGQAICYLTEISPHCE